MVHLTRTFVWFRVPLNHRLARKISKELSKVPDEDLLFRPELRNLKKYLKHMRKNNYRRFFKGQRTSKIEKRVRDRVIWVSASGGISIQNATPNPRYVTVYGNSIVSFETLIYCILHKNVQIPF